MGEKPLLLTRYRQGVLVADFQVICPAALDVWEMQNDQRYSVSVFVHHSLHEAMRTDVLKHSVNYTHIAERILRVSAALPHQVMTLENYTHLLAKQCCQLQNHNHGVVPVTQASSTDMSDLDKYPVPCITLQVKHHKALLYTDVVSYEITLCCKARNQQERWIDAAYTINKMHLRTLIGIWPWERIIPQPIYLTLTLTCDTVPADSIEAATSVNPIFDNTTPITNTYNATTLCSRQLIDKITNHVETQATCETVEMLAAQIADVCMPLTNAQHIQVRIGKPHAVHLADEAGVTISRDNSLPNQSSENNSNTTHHYAFIGLGSNLHDKMSRVNHIHEALRDIELLGSTNSNDPLCKIIDTSFLYESSARYFEEQPDFLNAVCLVKTRLEPKALLDRLQAIERQLGKDVRSWPNDSPLSERYGPRIIDLDILLYDDLIMTTDALKIPHPHLHERDFVLQPLCDISRNTIHPILKARLSALLRQLPFNQRSNLRKVMPIKDHLWSFDQNTILMGILNATPDSFSDHHAALVDAIKHADAMIAEGALIIDIGGASSRPYATTVSEEEEWRRIQPIIEELKRKHPTVVLSVDTHHATIAARAIKSGATMINDVSGVTHNDTAMLKVIADMQVPVCFMHLRGDSHTMNEHTSYVDVVGDVRMELGDKVTRALRAGVPRWHIFIDPGIGFAKNQQQNFVLLRSLKDLATDVLLGFPVLVGPSRKSFLNLLDPPTSNDTQERKGTKEDCSVSEQQSSTFLCRVPVERIWGTAAACTTAIAGGASVLRVHDVCEMRSVVTTADAIYKGVDSDEKSKKGFISLNT